MIGHLFSRRSFLSRRLPSPARNRIRPRLEELEARTLLSASTVDPVVTPLSQVVTSATDPTTTSDAKQTNSTPSGYSPSQIQSYYQFPTSTNGQPNGTGQTIAIVDAYNDPNLRSDLETFDTKFTIGSNPSTDTSFLTIVNQTGGSTLPAGNSSWGGEISLDVEWAHAMAPGANIVLVEASSNSVSDLMTAVSTASTYNGVSVVSMSWGAREFSGETTYDSVFAQYPNITFVASSGDYGPPPNWPAISPYVVAVGGTTLTISKNTETGWGDGRWTGIFGGSGGGISAYESQPSYQSGVVTQSSTWRTNPDVAYNANPNTGYAVYDTYGYGGWLEVGGTSAGAPQWSAIFAIANQERGSALGSEGLPALYNLYNTAYSSKDFRDITSGSNGYSAGPGYDLVTGIGTPIVGNLVGALAGFSSSAVITTATTSTTSTSTSHFNRHLDQHDLIQTADPAAPTGVNGSSASTTANNPTMANNPLVTVGTSGAGTMTVPGSTSATPFPVATALFGQTSTLTTPLTVGATGTTNAIASFTPFTGVFSVPHSDTAHAAGAYNDQTSVIVTSDDVPPAPPVIDSDAIEAMPIPVPAGNNDQTLLQPVSGCDACFANEQAMLALGADRDESALLEDDAAVTRSMGLALIGLGAVLSGFWIDRPGSTEEARRRAALLLLNEK